MQYETDRLLSQVSALMEGLGDNQQEPHSRCGQQLAHQQALVQRLELRMPIRRSPSECGQIDDKYAPLFTRIGEGDPKMWRCCFALSIKRTKFNNLLKSPHDKQLPETVTLAKMADRCYHPMRCSPHRAIYNSF